MAGDLTRCRFLRGEARKTARKRKKKRGENPKERKEYWSFFPCSPDTEKL